jgi:hypothetical protein
LRLLKNAGASGHSGTALYNAMDVTTAALMELFGWVRLEFTDPEEGKVSKVLAIESTECGDAMIDVLFHNFRHASWHPTADNPPCEPGVLRSIFQTCFPDYQNVMDIKELPYQDGTFVIHVSLGKVWRRIAAPDDATLDELALTILRAFEFDSDHLYCFVVRQPNGSILRIACPYEKDAVAWTDDFTLGELPIEEGGTMTMTFDYGTPWHFAIRLEEIRPTAKSSRPKVIAKGGKAPAQYEWE